MFDWAASQKDRRITSRQVHVLARALALQARTTCESVDWCGDAHTLRTFELRIDSRLIGCIAELPAAAHVCTMPYVDSDGDEDWENSPSPSPVAVKVRPAAPRCCLLLARLALSERVCHLRPRAVQGDQGQGCSGAASGSQQCCQCAGREGAGGNLPEEVAAGAHPVSSAWANAWRATSTVPVAAT